MEEYIDEIDNVFRFKDKDKFRGELSKLIDGIEKKTIDMDKFSIDFFSLLYANTSLTVEQAFDSYIERLKEIDERTST